MLRLIAILAVFCSAAPASAAWLIAPGITSDKIAASGGTLLAATAIPFTSGGATLTSHTTYWKWEGVTYRCVDSDYQGWQQCHKAVA